MSAVPAFRLVVPVSLAVALLGACSSNDSKPVETHPSVTTGDAAPASDSGGSGATAFNGDCSTARWGNVSDECWSCMCGACKAKLDVCNADCTAVLECAFENHALVNKNPDLGCEIRATGNLCLQDPKSQAVAQPLLNFDTCLIAAPKLAGEFRACDTACAVPYSGDVCTRFPPPAM